MPPKRKSSTSTAKRKKPKTRHCALTLVSIQVEDAYEIADYGNEQEWTANKGGAPNAACIQMGKPLSLLLTLKADRREGIEFLNLSFMATAKIGSKRILLQQDNIDITEDGDVDVFFKTPGPLHAGITVTEVVLTQFEIVGQDVSLDCPRSLTFEVFTIFGPPLRDNVKESTMVDPKQSATGTEVSRLLPFFSVKHLRLACGWAKGSDSLDPKTGIVATIVNNIPKVTYGENSDYRELNDGWNVWDNPNKRSADCSQLASFFADVLGTVGIRGVDLELKCDPVHKGKTYWHCFGDDPYWPTHGVLLVNYKSGGMWCYDTTFSDPPKRRIVSLADAIRVGKNQFIDKWGEWWLIDKQTGNPSDVDVDPTTAGWLDTHRGTVWWQKAMTAKATKLFPDNERQ